MTTERLPLFPLNTVLLPGMVLPLRIFEPRYRMMMRHVLAGERRFGVVLIRQGSDVDPTAESCDVGTIAEVTDVVPVQDGSMNISTTGRWRFRVTQLHHDQPYLTGDVESLSDGYEPSEGLQDLQAEVARLSLQYVTIVLSLSREQATQVHLPRDPVTLSFKVAGLLMSNQHQPAEGQRLLESPTVERRLYEEVLLLRRELAILRHMGDMVDPGDRLSPN